MLGRALPCPLLSPVVPGSSALAPPLPDTLEGHLKLQVVLGICTCIRNDPADLSTLMRMSDAHFSQRLARLLTSCPKAQFSVQHFGGARFAISD